MQSKQLCCACSDGGCYTAAQDHDPPAGVRILSTGQRRLLSLRSDHGVSKSARPAIWRQHKAA